MGQRIEAPTEQDIAFVDGTNISITGSAPFASQPYNVMLLVGEVANVGW
jgi:hypothetical protein